jgi:hypothetical protein
MKYMKDRSFFTVSLTLSAHQFARLAAKQQSLPQKIQQIYLNNLAIYAVNYYLQCLEIETKLEEYFKEVQENNNTKNISENTIVQYLSDSAFLEVKNKGKIECRFVLPDSDFCYIPAETWSDRIGCVAVLLNRELTEAKLLGFIPEMTIEKFPLEKLQPIENLLDCLGRVSSVVSLRQWFDRKFESGWQTLENILAEVDNLLPDRAENFAYNFRNHSDLNSLNRVERAKSIFLTKPSQENSSKNDWYREAKLVETGVEIKKYSLILLIAITPQDENKTGINIQLHAAPKEKYLPENIHLELLSSTEEIIKYVISHSYDNWIQLPYIKCDRDEMFGIRITLDGVRVSETFRA